MQKLFGVSRIKIDPQGFTTETSSTQTGPAVTIEQQVKNNLTLTYTTNVAGASQQIIQVEYNITRSVSSRGVAGPERCGQLRCPGPPAEEVRSLGLAVVGCSVGVAAGDSPASSGLD